jgi:hypothetical protein
MINYKSLDTSLSPLDHGYLERRQEMRVFDCVRRIEALSELDFSGAVDNLYKDLEDHALKNNLDPKEWEIVFWEELLEFGVVIKARFVRKSEVK